MATATTLDREEVLSAACDGLSVALGTANASTAPLVDAIASGLETRLWEVQECRSPEHWVMVRCGMSCARAHRLVRIARRIGEFPLVAALFAQGQVTEDHLDVIALHAHRSHDRDLEIAGCCTIGQLHRFIATLPVPVDPDPNPGPDDDDDDDGDPDPVDKQEPNAVTLGWGEDGRYRGRIDVDGKLGSLFELMLRAGRRKVYRDRHGSDTVDDADLAAVTGADAMEAAAHAALDALDPSTAKGGSPSSRYQVFVHIDADNPDRARIHLGPLLPRSVRDQILCDAELRAVLWRGGRPVGLGRKHRVADPLLRALIEERDGGCCVPGCERHGYLHIHHLVHWPAGGPTDPHNLVALCTEHHRLVHAGLLQLVGNPETGTFEVLDRHRERWPRHDEFRWF